MASPRFLLRQRRAFASVLLAVTPAIAMAETTAPAETQAPDSLPNVVVTATRSASDPASVPASVDAVAIDSSRHARSLVGLSDVLGGVPGVTVRNRQNYAQDEQVSIRGFGARATFGVRGVRLYADDIPASMPDGSGQVSHFNIEAAERIEVLRGPFSALYGNSSGGVIALYSAQGHDPDRWRLGLRSGSDGFWRAAIDGRGQVGAMGYNLALSRFRTDGFRDRSAARRDSGNVRLDWEFDDRRQLTLIANAVDMPDIQDPLGLTWEQAQANPRQAVANAELFNTRKSVTQQQLGTIFRQDIGETQSLRLLGYGGNRQVEQFLAIPAGTQNAPLHSGGVVDLDTDYQGADLRWQFDGEVAGRPLALVFGVSTDKQDQLRRGYENHVDGVLGVRGRLRRDERNRADSVDRYLQLDWRFADHWSLLAGARHSSVRFRSDDHYIAGANPDDSGRTRYSDTMPVAGLMFHATEALRFYASQGRGFETPTFAEISYRADGGAGLALALAPARSRNMELGTKWKIGRDLTVDTALFRADTDDELAVARNAGGRSSFQNVASARREGVELALDARLAEAWGVRLAYTRVMAEFRSPFLTCTGTLCLIPNTPVPAGSRIPGVPSSQIAAQLAFEEGPWRAALDVSRTGTTVVNDTATQSAPAYTLAGFEVARDFGALRLHARVDNLFGRQHIGSVIVNEGNGRFHEPGPGRQWQLGMQWTF